jgi:fibronectin type 3 domain-containing protein
MNAPSPRIICGALVVLLIAAVTAGAAGYDVRLQSRRFTPAEEVMRFEEPRHVVVQLYDIPTDAVREELARSGIRLLEYIPNYAWTASVEPGALAALEPGIVRAVFPLSPDDKVSQSVLGQTSVRVFVYDDVENPIDVLSRYGAVTPGDDGYYIIELEAGLAELASEDIVKYVMGPRPEKALENDVLRDAINADEVQSTPYDLHGSGLYAGIWDGGSVATNHDDFDGRLIIADGSSTHYHATMCAGIMAGDGSRSQAEGGTPYQWRGVATEVDIASYNWPSDCSDMDTETSSAISTYDIVVSSNSWGWGLCPDYCYYYGTYDDWSQNYDAIVRGSAGKKLTVVFSAGNDGDCNQCSGDLPDYPYGTIPGPGSTSKNAIVVGSTDADNDDLSDFSSRGPTLDGRLKPDVMAPGCKSYTGITTTYLYNDYAGSSCGTSFSCPAVSGSVILAQEDFIDKFGDEAWPSTMKALLVQGAEDLGNTGPDYRFGFGRIDIQNTVDIIRADGGTGDLIQEDSLSPSETWEYQVDVSGESELKVTLAWDDYQGDYMGSGAMLVNDLNLVVISPSRATYYPFLLDPDNPSNTATTGVDDLNNVEQVIVNSPAGGTWTIRVTAAVMPQPDQDFSVVTNVGPGAGDPPPAAPTGLDATSGTGQGEIDLDWNDNSEPDFDHYVVERADNPSFTGSTTWTAASSQYADSGLAPGETYHYRVYAVDTGSNQSGPSSSDSAVATDLPPAAPTGLSATPGSDEGEIDLDWNDNIESDFCHYRVERAMNPSFSGATSWTSGASGLTDSGLTPGERYYYRVFAVDLQSNESGPSTTDDAYATDLAPSVPTGLDATTGSGEGEIDLDWNDNTEGDFDHYVVERADNPSFTGSTTWTSASSDYADSGLTPGETYHYRVYAVDANSNQSGPSASDSAAAGDDPPAVPTGLLAAGGVAEGSIDLDWNDNAEPDFDHYVVERADNSLFTGSTTWTAASSEYADSGLTPGGRYWYRIYAVDTGTNQSGPSAPDDTWATNLAPQVPTGLTVEPGAAEGEIDVDWDDNTEPDFDHYRLERAENPSFTGSVSFSPDVSEFSDSGLTLGQPYYYRVYAVDAGDLESVPTAGKSSLPTDLAPAAPTGLAAATGTGEGEIDLDWNDNGEGDLDHYVVERADNPSFTGATTFTTGVSEYDDSGLVPGMTYHYRVYAVDGGDNQGPASDPSSAAAADLAPAAPTGVTAAPGPITGDIQVEWDANGELDLDHYRVERDTTDLFGAGAVSFETGDTSHLDESLPLGFTYYYRVFAVDTNENESAASDTVSQFLENTGIPEDMDAVVRYVRPNPFSQSTTVAYSVPAEGARVSIRVYDISGRLIQTLFEGPRNGGLHEASWRGRDRTGKLVSSGVYFCRVTIGNHTELRKIAYLR